MDIEKYIKATGETKTFSPKPQYVREEFVFECPICKEKIYLSQFLNYSYFKKYCEKHLETCMEKK